MTSILKESPANAHSQKTTSARWLRLAGRALLATTLLFLLLSNGRLNEVVNQWQQIRHMPFLAACGLYAVGQVLSSWRWQWLATSLGIQERLGRLVQLYFVGMFFNLFLPTSMGGDLVRSWYLAQLNQGTNFRAALTSVISERLNGLIALLLLGCLASLLVLDTLPIWEAALLWLMASVGIGGLILLPLASRFFERCRRLAEALSLSTQYRRTWAKAFALSVIIQTAAIVQVGWLAWALDLPVMWRYLVVAVPITTIISLLPVSIAGLGLREGSLVLLLAPAGWSSGQSIALGLSWLAMQALTSLIGAPLWWSLPMSPVQPVAETTTQLAQTGSALRNDVIPLDATCSVHHKTPQVSKSNAGEVRHGRLSSDSHQGREGQSTAAA